MKRGLWAMGAATLVLVTGVALLSSNAPDGLEWAAQRLGFAGRAGSTLPASPLADYQTRYFNSRWAAQASAGLAGALLVYALATLFGRSLKRKK